MEKSHKIPPVEEFSHLTKRALINNSVISQEEVCGGPTHFLNGPVITPSGGTRTSDSAQTPDIYFPK